MKQKKSAKDLAFEKERAKFRSEIRRLSDCIEVEQKEIAELNKAVSERDETIRQQKEWIERLLEYTELSEEDMRKIIQKEKRMLEIAEEYSGLMTCMRRLFY